MAGLVMKATCDAEAVGPDCWDLGYGDFVYYAWMTFHMRASGDLYPIGLASEVLSLLIVLAGNTCWVLPLMFVARKTVLDPAALLFSAGDDGRFKILLPRAFKSVVLPYFTCLILCLLLSCIGYASAGEDCDHFDDYGDDYDEHGDYVPGECTFGGNFYMLLTTFHGATWGHIYPWSHGQIFACAVMASAGYL
eukprot:TRINITY_DN40896_c0_g1_i1.p1 TRINITY_DN40896_c0_g1~~TRINITY_DN40896_c0_g1_i1.p1  ORF type:complete len:193 (-),score=21.45 TRINITY_DN40896_c0_g1_i1:776-1354(-)